MQSGPLSSAGDARRSDPAHPHKPVATGKTGHYALSESFPSGSDSSTGRGRIRRIDSTLPIMPGHARSWECVQINDAAQTDRADNARYLETDAAGNHQNYCCYESPVAGHSCIFVHAHGKTHPGSAVFRS